MTPPPSLSQELDEIPVESIIATVKALRSANQMADTHFPASAKMSAYIAAHDQVTDALEAYCRRRILAERAP